MHACFTRTIIAAIAALLTLTANAATLHTVGVIGNTGEQGSAIVRQTPNRGFRGHGNAVGCGIVLDRQGTLWTRMDDGCVSRLSLDGRQLGRFPAPPSSWKFDTLTGVGDQILLLDGNTLFALPTSATPGTAFQSLGISLRTIARTAVGNRVAVITGESKVAWYDPVTRTTSPVADMPNAWLIECDGTGNIYVGTHADGPSQKEKLHKLVQGKEITTGGWPKSISVVRPQDGACTTFVQWDGSTGFFVGNTYLSHVDTEFNPAPGTVLGTQGQFVIGGSGDWHPDMGVTRGVARIRNDLYAVCGTWGHPFFALWPNPANPMKLISWITAQPACQSLVIDGDGTVFCDRLVYPWEATPDIFPQVLDGSSTGLASQAARVNPHLIGRIDLWMHGSDSWAIPFYHGDRMQYGDWLNDDVNNRGKTLKKELWWDRCQQYVVKPAVCYPAGKDGTYIYLALATPTGGSALVMNANGSFLSDKGLVNFTTAQPGKVLTSLAMRDDRTLLAAIDGYVVEMARDGENWRETGRWNAWGPGPEDHFGKTINIACDAGQLLVTDADRHRLLWFEVASHRLKAQLGKTDSAGDGLETFTSPGVVSVCGTRAVVFDTGNQRLLKVVLAE